MNDPLEIIIKAITDATRNMSRSEYKETLNSVAEEIEIRLDALSIDEEKDAGQEEP